MVVPTSSGNTARQVMLLRDFGVTALHATPSYALHIADLARCRAKSCYDLVA